jgi:hypothetical protein
MAAETWMDADEALSMGFIDSITEEVRMAAKVQHADRYKHAPSKLVEGQRPRAARHQRDTYTYIAASQRSQ